ALPVRADRNGTKPVPAFILTADLNRRESDMAENLPVLFGNQRQGERLCSAKRIDDLPLLLVAVGHGAECLVRQATDFGGILRRLLANMHDALLHRLLS